MSEHERSETGMKKLDLGNDEAFPRDLAPFTADGIRAWVRRSLKAEIGQAEGVPPAFQRGVIGGFLDACDELLQSDLPDEARAHLSWIRDLLAMQSGGN